MAKKSTSKGTRVAKVNAEDLYETQLESAVKKYRLFLKEQGIPSQVYYPLPLHLQRAYKDLGYRTGDFPVSEELCNRVLSLPMHTELDEVQLAYISERIQHFFKS